MDTKALDEMLGAAEALLARFLDDERGTIAAAHLADVHAAFVDAGLAQLRPMLAWRHVVPLDALADALGRAEPTLHGVAAYAAACLDVEHATYFPEPSKESVVALVACADTHDNVGALALLRRLRPNKPLGDMYVLAMVAGSTRVAALLRAEPHFALNDESVRVLRVSTDDIDVMVDVLSHASVTLAMLRNFSAPSASLPSLRHKVAASLVAYTSDATTPFRFTTTEGASPSVAASNYMCGSTRDDRAVGVVAALARCWAQFDAQKNVLAFRVLVTNNTSYRRLLALLRELHAHGAIIQRRYRIVERREATLADGSTDEYTTDWDPSPMALLLDGVTMRPDDDIDVILDIEALLVSMGCDRCSTAKLYALAHGLDSHKRARDNDDE